MNSLSELNSFAATSINVTDNRLAKVKFDRVTPLLPLDQSAQRTTTTITVNPGINIVEIIKYATANVRLRVRTIKGDTDPITTSTVAWASLPSGVTLTTGTNVYTLSGINTVAAWEAVKSFSWTVSNDYASKPLWFLNIAIVYYDEELGTDVDVDFNAYDPDNYYLSKMLSVSTATTNGNIARLVSANLSATFRYREGSDAALTATTSMTASFDVTQRAALSSSSSLSVNATEYQKFTYLKNVPNQIILPEIVDFTDGSGLYAYQINISSTFGEIGTSTSSSSVWYAEGNRSYVNSQLSNVYYYPTYNRTSNSQFTVSYYKDAVLVYQKVFTIFYNGVGTMPTNVYSITSDSTWTPTLAEKKYSLMDMLIVGAGGSGANTNYQGTDPNFAPAGGTGGGGGQVLYYTNATISNSSYAAIIGQAVENQNGTSTQFAGYTANGGVKGSSSAYNVHPPTGRGGSSGAGYLGTYAQVVGSPDPYPFRVTNGAGGGAGAASSGSTNGPGFSSSESMGDLGGAGVNNSITGTGVEYGKGGPGRGAKGMWYSPSTNPGAGGGGGNHLSNVNITGRDGIVIIKTHS